MESGLRLPGYNIGAVLWRTDGRVVYQARRLDDGAELAIETLDAAYPDRKQVAVMRREIAVTQHLSKVEGVRNIHAVLSHGSGNLAMVTDLYDSSLALMLIKARGKGLAVTQVLDLALRLVRILGSVHGQDIVHKALTPQNILHDSNSGAITLCGFGIASELDQELQIAQMSLQPEGPLAYMSPEQTGRMNRDLDYRSDYYSLGVLLFQLLTGKLPFQTDNVLEWVHSHISRLPPVPHEIAEQVPEALSDIILKLLSKCPESRYQSAAGLMYDLWFCAHELAKGTQLSPFALGEREVAQKFLIPQSLYGREHELHQLLHFFEDAVAGHTRFCLVHGYSGVGKSALVNELDRYQVRERGFLVQGKFDQFQQGEAYSALVATFRALVQQVLLESDELLAQWRQRIQDALAPNAALVLDLVPELELIIGEQPAVATLPPAEAHNRLQHVLSAFLRVFAGNGHPVVLFLDDLQWSDTPTLQLLRRIVTSKEQSHLLLIGAYRSNEVGAGHPLQALMDDLKAQDNIHQLPLAPLDKASITHLVADSLRREVEDVQVLSDMLYSKAQGNPFFTTELLRQLHKQGFITRDIDSGCWNWDLDAANWPDVSGDVVDFMLDNLRQLSTETQQVLQLAACIGSSFDLQMLSTIYEATVGETATALLPALKQHTVLPLHGDYRLVGENNEAPAFNPRYRFQHDRVQQAAYALIDQKQRAYVHLSVGRLLLQHTGDSVPNDRLIDIVGHLNEGRSLIELADERLALAQLNLRAGMRARASTAYEAALSYLQIAAELLDDDAWQQTPTLMQKLVAETQQCYYLTGHSEEADHWIKVMLVHAESDLQRSNMLAIRTRQYATLGRMEDSILSAIEGLALLGVEFTDQPTLKDIADERRRVDEYLAGRAIADLVDAVIVDDPAILTAMRLLMEIFAAAFLSGSGNLFPYLVLKSVNLSLRHGNSPESAFAYASYGMLLCGELDEPGLGYQYGKVGLSINDRLDDVTLRARVIYVYAMFVHHWSNHWSTLTPWFRKGIEAGYQSGDLLYLAYSAQDCVIWDPTLDLEASHRQHAENLDIVRQCAYQDSFDSGTLFLQLQRNMLGLTHTAFTLSDDIFDEQQCIEGMHARQFMTGIANNAIYNAEISFLYGNYKRALDYVKVQDALIKSAMSLPQLVRFYIVANLTLTTHYANMDADEKLVTLQRLQKDLARMRRWADNCEDNFRHLQYLMEAELLRIDGRADAALARYDLAIDAARESGFLRDEATAFERAARHLLALGKCRSAQGYLQGAHCVYDRWGAQRKVSQLENEFPILREFASASVTAVMNTGNVDLDLASVMKASREISGEMLLQRLLKKTMAIVLENAGGQWGCLVVRSDGRLHVQAAKLPAEGLAVDSVPGFSVLPDPEGGQVPLPMTLINHVFLYGEAVVLHDAAREGAFVRDPYVFNLRPRSVLCVPIQRERFEGVLYMENNLASAVFTEARVETIRLLAAQASVAIENASLYEQVQDYSRTLEDKVVERTVKLEQANHELQRLADRDGLTGVANRRRADNYMQESWLRSCREPQPQPLSIIMLDVDHFKAFNDNYGHQMGDDCLVKVAETVQAALLRPGDLAARYGGEEFILILPNTDMEGAALVGEKVRHAIEALAVKHAYSSVSALVTVSCGISTTVPSIEASPADLIGEADKALYRAKKMGRNQVYAAADIITV